MDSPKAYVKLWMSYEQYFAAYGDEEVGRITRAMLRYRSTGESPNFPGPERYVWPAIQRDIDESLDAQIRISAQNRANGRLGGRPKKEKAPESENVLSLSDSTENSHGQGQGHSQGYSQSQTSPFSGELQEAFDAWLRYKAERSEAYTPTGLQALIHEIEVAAGRHGEAAVAALIHQCMANGWKGIIYEKLDTFKKIPNAPTPSTGPSVGPKDDMDLMRHIMDDVTTEV